MKKFNFVANSGLQIFINILTYKIFFLALDSLRRIHVSVISLVLHLKDINTYIKYSF